jgi:hypothetical protein
MNSTDKTQLRFAALLLVFTLVLGATYLIRDYMTKQNSYAAAEALVSSLIADPARPITRDEDTILLYYIVGNVQAMPAGSVTPPERERQLIQAILRRYDLTKDVNLYWHLNYQWKHSETFRDLPALVSAYIDRRDDKAKKLLVMTYPEVKTALLTEARVRQWLTPPLSDDWLHELIMYSSSAVFQSTVKDYMALHSQGKLSDYEWANVNKRIQREAKLKPVSKP